MKLVFYGLDAYVRSWAGKQIYFSPENPAHNPNVFVPLDLDKTPSAAQGGKIAWGDVLVDDVGEAKGAKTTVNPWDTGGRRKGAVWVEERHLQLLRRLFDLPVPSAGAPHEKLYENMSVRYYAEDPSGDRRRVGNRYLGFHAKVLDPATRKVKIWHAGTSGDPTPQKEPVIVDGLDFDDPAKVDFPVTAHGSTEIGVRDGQAREGALFLDDRYAAALEVEGGGKKPANQGL